MGYLHVNFIITVYSPTSITSLFYPVSKTVRPMLSDRCLSGLSVLSVTLMYCGQTVGWIKMKLGMEVGLGPGHIVLDGDSAPPQTGTTLPNFQPMSVVANRLDGLKCHLIRRYRPQPRRHCVKRGSRSQKKRKIRSTAPNVRPMYIVDKRSPISMSTC